MAAIRKEFRSRTSDVGIAGATGRPDVFVALLLCLIVLASCGTTVVDPKKTQVTDYKPVTITDCGEQQTTFTKIPERVVTMDGESAEMLVTLGLHKHIVGAGYLSELSELPAHVAADMQKVPKLSDEYPSKEALLSTAPDLVISFLPSAFRSESGMFSRDDLAKKGINSYSSYGQCPGRTDTDTLESTFTDMVNLGKIFNIEDQVTRIIEQMRSDLADIQEKIKGQTPVRVFAIENPSGAPYTIGGGGTGNAVVTLAGGKNIFSDVPKAFTSASWEEVVARDPEIIWLVTNVGGNPACCKGEEIKNALLQNPALANVTAIKEQRFIEIPFSIGAIESIRNVEAVTRLARALRPVEVK